MTRDEIKQMLAFMSGVWATYKPEDKTTAVDVAYVILYPYTKAEIQKALMYFVDKGYKFPPSMAELKSTADSNRACANYERLIVADMRKLSLLPPADEMGVLTDGKS